MLEVLGSGFDKDIVVRVLGSDIPPLSGICSPPPAFSSVLLCALLMTGNRVSRAVVIDMKMH